MKKLLPFLLILITVFLAYGQSINMYFWQDDSALIFKLQHLMEGSGSFGTGIIGGGPYRYLVVPFVPLYPLFGLEPSGYFFGGIIMYFFAALAVYFFTKELTKDKRISLISALIFSSGYVGSDTMWRIINSYQTSISIILICLTIVFYKRFIDTKFFFYYLFSIILFLFTMETTYVRAHGILFLVLGLEFLLNFRLLPSIIRSLPFIYFYCVWYVIGNSSKTAVPLLVKNIFVDKQLEIILTPLKTLENIFIPDIFNFNIFLFLFVLFIFLIWRRNRLLWYSIIFMVSNYLVYFLQYQEVILSTTHRYLTPSFVGLCLFLGIFLNQFFKDKKKLYFFGSAIIIFYLLLVNAYESEIVNRRSIPTRKFYQQLKTEVPILPKKSVVYFDVKDDSESSYQFSNFFAVGSMPNTTALAIYYGIDRNEILMPENFKELLSLIKENKVKKENVYTFYYSSIVGLQNTTEESKKNLFGTNQKEIIVKDIQNISYPIFTPMEFKVNLAADFDSKIDTGKTNKIDIKKYLLYLDSKNNYYDKVTATSSSQWRYQEIENIVDNKTETSWMGHRMTWHEISKESVIINLGEERKIGAIKFIFNSLRRVPTSYSIGCSENDNNWITLGDFFLNPKDEPLTIINKVPVNLCQFVRIDMSKTIGGDSPQIAELEVIDDSYKDINLQLVNNFIYNPLSFVSSKEDQLVVNNYLINNGLNVKACYYTNKRTVPDDNLCQVFNIKPGIQTYKLIIPQAGTFLQKIELIKPDELKIKVMQASIRPLSFDELLNSNYIPNFSQN